MIRLLQILSLVGGIVGCVPEENNNDKINNNMTNNINKAAVCIGLEYVNPNYYSGWNGDCPGCEKDSRTMTNLAYKNEFKNVKLLLNKEATWENVKNSIIKAANSLDLNSNPLLMISYSGHGGQYRTSDLQNEPDGYDETLCLYDGQVRDNEIAKLFNSLPKGIRIFFVTDCCHSETNFQTGDNKNDQFDDRPRITNPSVFGTSLANKLNSSQLANGSSSRANNETVRMLHISGCLDSEFSYGSVYGGELTNSLKEHFNSNKSYKKWFEDSKNLPNQHPVMNYTGVPFYDMNALQ